MRLLVLYIVGGVNGHISIVKKFNVRVDDWTAERVTIVSNENIKFSVFSLFVESLLSVQNIWGTTNLSIKTETRHAQCQEHCVKQVSYELHKLYYSLQTKL